MFVSILVAIIVLSVLVLVHEFGHYFMAKRAGVWVEEFGIGIPPRVWGKKIGETIYSVNLLPFGGFVRLHGEQSEEGVTKPKRAFINQKKTTKVKIIVAGVVMNFLLAVLCFAIVYSFSGIPREIDAVKVVGIAANSPASEIGLKEGDLITGVDSEEIKNTEDFINFVEQRKGTEIALVVEREGTVVSYELTPRIDPPEGEGALGVLITSSEIYFPPIWQRPFLGVYYGFQEAIFWGVTIIASLGQIFSNLISGTVPKGISGPVGIYAITSEAAKDGMVALINFVGLFSVNLAILNIIPFPALDGGRLLFIFIEGIFGRKVVPKTEAIIHAVGMAILLLLILLITFSDVKKLIEAGSISGFLEAVLR